MQYEIVTSRYAHEVTEKVNDLLREGWSLHGELKIAAYFAAGASPREEHAHVWMYAQAMIKKEKKRSKMRSAQPPTPSVT
jgi:hypothetical protein